MVALLEDASVFLTRIFLSVFYNLVNFIYTLNLAFQTGMFTDGWASESCAVCSVLCALSVSSSQRELSFSITCICFLSMRVCCSRLHCGYFI